MNPRALAGLVTGSWVQIPTHYSPFCDAFMGSDDRGLNVYRVIPHPPQLHRFVQRPHHVQGIVALCAGSGERV